MNRHCHCNALVFASAVLASVTLGSWNAQGAELKTEHLKAISRGKSWLIKAQNRDGSWDRERTGHRLYVNAYTTALIVLALTTPDQLLPIYQR